MNQIRLKGMTNEGGTTYASFDVIGNDGVRCLRFRNVEVWPLSLGFADATLNGRALDLDDDDEAMPWDVQKLVIYAIRAGSEGL